LKKVLTVVVYGKPDCPFCDRATSVLAYNNIKYTYININEDFEAANFLFMAGHKTVPQIYVNGEYHGESESAKTVGVNVVRVTKRDGTLEVLDLNKIHKVVEWAAEGLDVSVSQVELEAHLKFFDKMTTEDIQKTLIKSAADLISVEYPDYQYMASRLVVFNLRKKVYGKFTPPHLLSHVRDKTQKGWYDKHILADYTEAEFDTLNSHINHELDMKFAYAGIMQLEGKYLVQDRVKKQVFETPQFLYMLVGMCLFSKYPKSTRIHFIKTFYDETSSFKLSLPTPIMAGVRTPTRQFSSCVLIESGDSLDSINAATSSIVKYISQRAGIGINGGRLRALGSAIRNGEAVHTGVIPFWKMFQTAVKSCSQGGVRGGAATVFYPLWHLEVESLLVLKNNKGIEENRIRHMDYGVQLNKLMYERLITDGYITLFSPSDVEGMYDAFFEDQDKFNRLYIAAEGDSSIRQKRVKAVELFSLMMQERASTGRIYIQNVDHCNTNSPFDPKVAPIRQSNLCLEIALPTKPLNNVDDEDGEVALCTLAAFNLGMIKSLKDLERTADIAVRALDALLDYQNYPLPAAKRSSMGRRTLGIGAINYANWIAKQGLKYSDGSANNKTHELFEAIQYYCLKASNNLAKEVGACPYFSDTTYAKGVLPIDRYKKSVDDLHSAELLLDWESLRSDIAAHGLRNSTLTALMPAETSAQVSNSTNGIEPPRGLVSIKSSKDGQLKQVVPDIKKLKNSYELLWDIPSNKGYLDLVGIMQKFVDQAISANTNYDPNKFPDGLVPLQQMIADILHAYKVGAKTLYYHNTRDGSSQSQDEVVEVEDESCGSGGCKI
jgi:ribonucleoside-diphosphate reductase alpha chain